MKNSKLPWRISQDFKEGPVAQAIIEAAHKNVGSEDTLAVDKANVCVKKQTIGSEDTFAVDNANVCVKKQTMRDIISFLL